MTPSQALQAASEALYGAWSPSALGSDLGVCDRTVRRWRHSSDEYPIRDRITSELKVLCHKRAFKLLALVDKL